MTSPLATPPVRAVQRVAWPPQDQGALTPREAQVLTGMASGFSNQQIGARLHLSVETVRTYGKRIFRKLGARDRAHAAVLGVKLGVVDLAAITAAG